MPNDLQAAASWSSRAPLSIAMIAPCPFPTHQGTQVVIRHLAQALARAGHHVHVITYGYGEADVDPPYHVHRTPRIDAGQRSGPSLLKPAADAALLFTAARVIKAHKCDVIHAHNVEGLGIGALLKMQTGLPLVYHAHNAMGPELPTYFKAQLMQAFASAVGDVLDRTLPHAADAVIVFDADHKALHEVYGIAPTALHVIPPGIFREELQGAPPALVERTRAFLGEGPWLLYAGNPDGYQNLPLLFRALKMVRAEQPRVRLLIATHHSPRAFAAAIRAEGVQDGVEVQQHKTLDELKALYAVADLGVCPRTLWTGAPIKILNYLAAGLPVVACRSAARHILPASAGTLVNATPEAFAQGILELMRRTKAERMRWAVQATRAFERFQVAEHVGLYEDVYRQVIGKT